MPIHRLKVEKQKSHSNRVSEIFGYIILNSGKPLEIRQIPINLLKYTSIPQPIVISSRRQFIQSANLAGGASLAFAFIFCSSERGTHPLSERYATLDAVLRQPVLKRELFPSPVIIDSLEFLRDRDNCICRVRPKEGAEGLSIGPPFIAKSSWPTFVHNLHHHFAGKDARDLDGLIYNAHGNNIKRQVIPLCL